MKGRTVPPPSIESRVQAVDRRDREYFRTHPGSTSYRRAYEPGEWPGFDNDDDDLPFRFTLVSRIDHALHRWFFTDRTEVPRYGFTSTPDPQSLQAVREFMERLAHVEGIQISEVQP